MIKILLLIFISFSCRNILESEAYENEGLPLAIDQRFCMCDQLSAKILAGINTGDKVAEDDVPYLGRVFAVMLTNKNGKLLKILNFNFISETRTNNKIKIR